MDKRTKQKLHSINRAKEIYKIALEDEDYERLAFQISSNEAIFLSKQSNRVSHWMVSLDYKSWYPVVYDNERKSIVTFLANGYRHTNFLVENCVSNRIVSKSKYAAANILTNAVCKKAIRAVVSFGDPGTLPPNGFDELEASKLRLEFHDVNQGGSSFRKPRESDVQELIDFGNKVLPNLKKNEFILVHCQAGMGRSPAAAYILRCMLTGPGEEMNSVYAMSKENSAALPNASMVEYADKILNREGNMVRAREINCGYYWYGLQ
jgi:predicted protein tyrosine phosphatase